MPPYETQIQIFHLVEPYIQFLQHYLELQKLAKIW
jgi:hypothetical protein